MGNLCQVGFPRPKPQRRHTTSSLRRPVTVDRDAETDIQDELTTVSRDKTTAFRPHLITFYYPGDTSAHITRKLPKARQYKQMDQTILIGRGMDVDVMLNEEHIPRQFAEVRCKCNPYSEPKWYLKNVSEKKLIQMYLNGVRKCLKYQDEAELQDGCELNLDILTFVMKTEDGELGNMEGFEMEIRQMENDSPHSSSGDGLNSWTRKPSNHSTTTNNSVTSAQGRGRQGSASAKGSDQRSLQCQNIDHGHFGEPAPVVQHLVHYCPNVFSPGSPGSTCCLHHHPYGCPQQQHQHCHACHPAGQFIPSLRKQSDQEVPMQIAQTPPPSVNAMGLGYLPQEAGPAAVASSVRKQSSFDSAQKDPAFCGVPTMPREQFSSQLPGNLAMQQMLTTSESTNTAGYAMPELYGVLSNSTLMYGPPALHQPSHLIQPFALPLQQPLGNYAGLQPAVPAQPLYMNILRRSQSLFSRPKRSPEHRQRRSSCDGAQLTAGMVAQPESAMIRMSMAHGFSETDVTSLALQETDVSTFALQETAHKVYRIPSKDAASQSTQIDSLKFGSPALAMIGSNSTAVTAYTSTDMSRGRLDTWDVPDCTMMSTSSAHADIALNSRFPVESFSDALPSSAGFSSMNSELSNSKPWRNHAGEKSQRSRRQPQENDERQPEEKSAQF